MIYLLLIGIGLFCFYAGVRHEQSRERRWPVEPSTFGINQQWRELDEPTSRRRARLEVVR